MRHALVLALFFAASAFGTESVFGGLSVGEAAPAVRGSAWVGVEKAPELRGKVVLLDFWFSNCLACNGAAPEINRLAQKYRKDGLVVVGPSLDGEAAVQKFSETHSLTYPLLADAGGMARAYEVHSYPFLVLVGKNGRILWCANFKDESLTAAIETALKSK